MRATTVTRLNDADRAVDYSSILRSHVNPRDDKGRPIEIRWHQRARDYFVNWKLGIQIAENFVQDQYGNTYIVFLAKLSNGEIYASVAWLGAEKWIGTEKKLVLVKQWKKFKTFDAELRDHLRELAALDFGRAQLEVFQVQHTLQHSRN